MEMNVKNIAMKFVAVLLTGMLVSGAAWAEGKGKSHEGNSGGSCSIESRDEHIGFQGDDGKVAQFGDLTLRQVRSMGTGGSVFDIKGPNGFLRRNVELKAGVPVIFDLCGKEVTVMDTGGAVRVSAF
jgi:hypothetical protein